MNIEGWRVLEQHTYTQEKAVINTFNHFYLFIIYDDFLLINSRRRINQYKDDSFLFQIKFLPSF